MPEWLLRTKCGLSHPTEPGLAAKATVEEGKALRSDKCKTGSGGCIWMATLGEDNPAIASEVQQLCTKISTT